jgi:hypothetical protein
MFQVLINIHKNKVKIFNNQNVFACIELVLIPK